MAAPRKTSTDTDAKVADAYANGVSVASIAAEHSLSAGTVRAIVIRTGGTLRPVGRPKASKIALRRRAASFATIARDGESASADPGSKR